MRVTSLATNMADNHNWSTVCLQIIERQKENKRVKRDKDVDEICLFDQKLEGLCDFGIYRNLKFLWLSNNRLRSIGGLSSNCTLTELHLQYNLLKDISGALEHLTELQVLMLQGNQLTNLEKIVHEFRRMQNLQILNMFDNPIAQEKDYRHYTLHHVSSVILLDRKEVTSKEKANASKIYDQENEMVRDTIAFMRRSQGPPALYYKRCYDLKLTTPKSLSHHQIAQKPTVEERKEEFEARMRTKALWTYNQFDWSKIPSTEDRRLLNLQCVPETLSMAFK